MIHGKPQLHPRTGGHAGYTLVETLMATAVAAILMAGLPSAIFIANQSLRQESGAQNAISGTST